MGAAAGRAETVEELIARLASAPAAGELREAIASALGDSTLRIAYWLPRQERWVDRLGRPVEVPAASDARCATTRVMCDGELVAALVHEARIAGAQTTLRAAAAAGRALEGERREAELRARLSDAVASRARIVEAEESDRRRLERNLHDGPQQRLVSLALELKLARGKVASDPAGASAVLERAERELKGAIDDLREIARAIHPAVLSDRGLKPALVALTHRAPVQVELDCLVEGRLPAAVESAVYFVVSEALTSAVEHAHASEVTVEVAHRHGKALVQVKHDGVGGADTRIVGLADRVSALGGCVDVDSHPGEGAVVYAEIPCE